MKKSPQATSAIQQRALAALVAQRQAVDDLRKRLADAEKSEKDAEMAIMTALDQGIPLEPGHYLVAVQESSRRIVPWKEVVAKRLGPKVVEEAIAQTEPTIYRKLVVTAQAAVRRVVA